MTEEIVALCKAMGADGDREELLLPLARAVVSAMEGRLRAGVTPADCGDAFPLAAALLSWGGLSVHCQTLSVTPGLSHRWYWRGKAIQCLLSFAMAALLQSGLAVL